MCGAFFMSLEFLKYINFFCQSDNSSSISSYHRFMKIRCYILFTLLLSASISLQAYAMPGEVLAYAKAEIQPVNEKPSDSTSHNLLFSVHHQSERSIYSSGSGSLLTAENLTEEDTYGTRSAEQFRSWLSSVYLEKLGITEVSLTVKKLIFPFHSHL